MMKFKKLFASALAIAMVFCNGATNITAADLSLDPSSYDKDVLVEALTFEENALQNDEERIDFISESEALPFIEASEDDLVELNATDSIDITHMNFDKVNSNSIEVTSEENFAIATMSANTPPVADLTYMIYNPASLINGKITTSTIIFWLWEDEEYIYTYDPDGDEIVQYLVGGINDYIISDVYLDNQVVGFATQITDAAEHEFLYQVVDSNGAASNLVQLNIEVEPSDGTSRPIVSTTTTPSNPTTTQNVTVSWANSYDPDGDSLSGLRARVYQPNGNYINITSASTYYVGMVNNGIVLKFPSTGTYQIWTSLSDTNGNWSNWSKRSVTVTQAVSYRFRSVTVTSADANNTNPTAFTWGDYETALELRDQTNSPALLYDHVKQGTYPSEFNNKYFMDTDFTISGYVETTTGLPVANEEVTIQVPLPGRSFVTRVNTNSNGYFTYTCNTTKWWAGQNVVHDPNLYMTTGSVTKWCRWGNNYTTSWKIATNLYVSCDRVSGYDITPVVATAGSSHYRMLAHYWVYIPVGGTYQWYAI